MKLIVQREEIVRNSLPGTLLIAAEAPIVYCYTLENAGKSIPVGEYAVTLYQSPSFHRQVILLHDVPGRDFIEVHPANWYTQLRGCIAVGEDRAVDGSLIHSLRAFEALVEKVTQTIKCGQPCSIEVKAAVAAKG